MHLAENNTNKITILHNNNATQRDEALYLKQNSPDESWKGMTSYFEHLCSIMTTWQGCEEKTAAGV